MDFPSPMIHLALELKIKRKANSFFSEKHGSYKLEKLL